MCSIIEKPGLTFFQIIFPIPHLSIQERECPEIYLKVKILFFHRTEPVVRINYVAGATVFFSLQNIRILKFKNADGICYSALKTLHFAILLKSGKQSKAYCTHEKYT